MDAEQDAEDVSEEANLPETPDRIRENRLSLEEKRELEQRAMRPGSSYAEERWRKTAPERIDDIQSRIDQLTGGPSKARTGRPSASKGRATEPVGTSEKRLPPGLRSRLREELGPLHHVRLVYATSRHHVCRVQLLEDGATTRLVVLVGPETIRAFDTVREAIDELVATERGQRDTAEHAAAVATEDDPFGDVHPVIEVEGIGEAYTAKLAELGIEDTRQLWHADTEEVARHLDISPKVVTRWQQMVELIALPEIGPQYAELLVRSGIPSIQALSEAEPEALVEAIEAKQEELDVQIQGNVVRTGRAARWINVAREHLGLELIDAPGPQEPEARVSPFGDVDGITEVEGIGETYAEALAELEIVDTPSLWQADTDVVAQHLDISPKVVSRWQAQAELMAISGIGPQYAELLVRSGVTTIAQLAKADAEELLKAVEAKQDELDIKIQGSTIGKGRVEGWIEMARDHSP